MIKFSLNIMAQIETAFLSKFKAYCLEKSHGYILMMKQGRKRPLDTPKRMIERREREGERAKER